ncbi:MAG: TlpA family protein disulfide reductase [Flavobacteriaceae bacterium]
MKNLITFALVLLLFSCAKEEKPEYTIVSGKITNFDDQSFKIYGNSFEKEITLSQDGTFTDTLYIAYNGAYGIGRQPLYLHKGKNLSFEVDVNQIEDFLFSGDLAAENNYFVQKAKLRKEILGAELKELYALEEDAFLSKLDELDQKQNELLESTTFSVEGFKEKELRSFKYHKEFVLGRFGRYHAHFAQKPDFEVSENFPKADQTIDFDNAEEFEFSGAFGSYGQLISANFDKKISEEYKKEVEEDAIFDEAIHNQTSLKVFKTIKSQNIKNAIAKTVAYGINPANEKSEELYNEIMANVTDESFKTELTEKYNKIKTLVKGNPSPKFDYENHKGGTTSLDDLKGKIVYIDVWATWCGPCKREIPFLKEIEKQYHGKNIEFVSISIDDTKDYDKWKEFVTKEELGGVQLYADNAWQSQFAKDYAIESIPRFILVDTEGNIVSADAPIPSDPKLVELLTEVGL